MRLNVEVTVTDKRVGQIVKAIEAGEMTKGAAIRECFAGGLEVKDISQKLGIRYNHVYNVVKNEVLVKGLADDVIQSERGGANSKKAQIVQMLQDGKTITEISTELKCMYNYVWAVARDAGFTGKKAEAKAESKTESKKGKKQQATA